jgi:hypothetical protein
MALQRLPARWHRQGALPSPECSSNRQFAQGDECHKG